MFLPVPGKERLLEQCTVDLSSGHNIGKSLPDIAHLATGPLGQNVMKSEFRAIKERCQWEEIREANVPNIHSLQIYCPQPR